MGTLAAGFRLSPNAGSLGTFDRSDRLRHSFFDIANTVACAQEKVNCFSPDVQFL